MNLFVILYYVNQKTSECVPVCKNSRVSSLLFCFQVISQSGPMWHSHSSAWSPFNRCGRYWLGKEPLAARACITVWIFVISNPLFLHLFKSFLNRFVYVMLYAIIHLRSV